MELIGLIAAMAIERNALLRHIKGWKRVKVQDLEGIYFELPSKTCILVTSGMGMQRARIATQKLIQSYAPQWLISFGIAGAAEDELQIGDVIAVRAVCQLHEHALSTLKQLHFWPNEGIELAEQELVTRNAHLLTGTAVTTVGTQPDLLVLEEMYHPILDMETAGIAQVAEENGIPFSALRAVSDCPSAPLPFDLGEMVDNHANLRLGRLLMEIVRHPGAALKFSQVQTNARIAADRVAVALVALIEQATIPSPGS
jgi:adenosylhomocysteine nucleosidase